MRLIDADELLTKTEDYGEGQYSMMLIDPYYVKKAETVQAIIIPVGATNGEMFRAVFGYEPATDSVVCNKEDWCGVGEPCKYCGSNSDSIGREEDWWNAPYKKE